MAGARAALVVYRLRSLLRAGVAAARHRRAAMSRHLAAGRAASKVVARAAVKACLPRMRQRLTAAAVATVLALQVAMPFMEAAGARLRAARRACLYTAAMAGLARLVLPLLVVVVVHQRVRAAKSAFGYSDGLKNMVIIDKPQELT